MLCYCLSPRRRGRKDVCNIECSSGTGNSHCSADTSSENGQTQSFTFFDLATATEKFSFTNLIGQGGFGKVYKGCLKTGQTVAIKLLDRDGIQGNREFVTEVLLLSVLDHSNLVKLIGYCNDGDSRGLVYEYIPGGSLDNHLFGVTHGKRTLEWNARIKIAFGVARGLKYLHCEVDPPVIHRDLKTGNILLDEDFSPKLSDFGLAKLGPVGDKSHVTTRVMGTNGYCAPEYMKTGQLTKKSDVFSFGVLLLELITGRKSIDSTRRHGERDLVAWARPLFKDPKELVDPLLQGRFSFSCLRHLLAVTAMCLHEEQNYRPLIRDVLVELEYLASRPYVPEDIETKINH